MNLKSHDLPKHAEAAIFTFYYEIIIITESILNRAFDVFSKFITEAMI
jgi:hypothetical protein